MNNFIIREIKKEEYRLLDNFLYEAIFIPDGVEKPPRKIIKNRELQVYVKDFGKSKDDNCLVAECNGEVVGACWSRIMDDYGHVDDETPSLAISLYEEYRGMKIGTKMMEHLMVLLKEKGYNKVSLSVNKNNYAVKMYKKLGFKPVRENEEDYIMICDLG